MSDNTHMLIFQTVDSVTFASHQLSTQLFCV